MIDLYDWPTPNGHKVTMFLDEADLHYRIHHVDISAGDQFKPEFLAISPNNRMPAGDACTIADMAAYPWIVPWKRQQQNLDDFPDLRRWFDEIAARPGTIGAYAKGAPYSHRRTVTEQGESILFGQTAATSASR